MTLTRRQVLLLAITLSIACWSPIIWAIGAVGGLW